MFLIKTERDSLVPPKTMMSKR